MAPPSQLAIAASSVQRLVKEEGSYKKELAQQQARVEKLVASPDDDGNKDYQLKQEKAAIKETEQVFAPLRERTAIALQKLKSQLEAGQESGASEEDISKAKTVIEQATAAAEAQ